MAVALSSPASNSSRFAAAAPQSSFAVGSIRTLFCAPGIGFGVSNGCRVVAMATKKVSARPALGKKSWLPGVKAGGNLVDPEWLDGSWAMAAVVGILVGQAWSGVPWFEAGAQPEAIAPFSFGTLLGTQLLLMGWVESKRWVDFFNPGTQALEWATPWSLTYENFANSTGLQGYPGGKFFDPLGLAGEIKGGKYVPDFDKLSRLQTAEIKHGRLAMVAMLIFYLEAGQGLTPLGALGL
ncbi:hypothetical protein O6H91_18G073600 [Diphasiastrum complanatum]|uniref:Uncharacterized protein n=1 Tax=Diphasiastrum complanatum TaxID=34168 RepID=A0ACC2B3M0_DIPCM|nr:hypothetical protein O6H91_18G073600 [Diphasiastrum complanatum]